ncbi:MAG TPA: carboxypeptidase-like regulatory domain-containing protein [Bryobacteraceae bacterium]|nr:carboxypeptidase-like regulatory domain-containing protein [Bryobacteraceae bacterium]
MSPEDLEISGQVLYHAQPVAGATVWLVASEYRLGILCRFRLGPRVTDNHGKFRFDSDLEQGCEYYVLAERHVPSADSADDALPAGQQSPIQATTYYGDAPSLTTGMPIVLGPREHRDDVNISMRKAMSYCVSGMVKVYDMPFALYLTVQESALARSDGSIHQGASGQDGSFRFCGLTPGEYALFTPENGNGIAHFSVTDADVRGVLLNVDTTPSELRLELSCEDDVPPRPEAQSTDIRWCGPQKALVPADRTGWDYDSSSSTPEDGISVRLLREDGFSFVQTLSAPFVSTFEPLSSGDYGVDVIPPPGWYVKRLTLGGISLAARTMHLSPGSLEILRIVVSPGAGAIKCEVTDEDGGPMPDTPVTLIPEGVYSAAQLSLYARQMRTDSRGALQVGALPPGVYRVIALRRPFRPIREDLEKLLLITSIGRKVEVTEGATIYVKLRPVSLE